MATKEAKKLKKELKEAPKPKLQAKKEELLSSPSTLLNLSVTGRTYGCYRKGRYYFIVGQSRAGKTWLAMCAFAEAALNPDFKNYRFIYDSPEVGAEMDQEFFFGSEVKERLEPPAKDDDGGVFSETIDDFYDNVWNAIDEGEPFIYVLDSMDSVSESDEAELEEKNRTARKKGNKEKGSYGAGKAKANSKRLKRIVHKLAKTGSILIIIGQERDVMGFTMNPGEKGHSGGHALDFYANTTLWLKLRKKLTKPIGKKQVPVGVEAKIQVKKNRSTGKDRSVIVPIYHDAGVDDTGSMVDYLTEWNHWKKKKGMIAAPEFDTQLRREELIQWIEEENKEQELKKIVGKVWRDIEDKVRVHRKRKYQ